MGNPKWWNHSCDTRKRNYKKTSTIVVLEIKTEDEEVNKASTLVMSTNKSGKVLNISTHVFNSAWIIDSNVTDHITFYSRHVLSLNSSKKKFVCATSVTTTLVIGEGLYPILIICI